MKRSDACNGHPNFKSRNSCYFFSEGHCQRGLRCKFAHGIRDVQSLKNLPTSQATFAHGIRDVQSVKNPPTRPAKLAHDIRDLQSVQNPPTGQAKLAYDIGDVQSVKISPIGQAAKNFSSSIQSNPPQSRDQLATGTSRSTQTSDDFHSALVPLASQDTHLQSSQRTRYPSPRYQGNNCSEFLQMGHDRIWAPLAGSEFGWPEWFQRDQVSHPTEHTRIMPMYLAYFIPVAWYPYHPIPPGYERTVDLSYQTEAIGPIQRKPDVSTTLSSLQRESTLPTSCTIGSSNSRCEDDIEATVLSSLSYVFEPSQS